MFDIDYTKLIRLLLPFNFRKFPNLLALLDASVNSIKNLYIDFILFRNNKKQDMQYSSQTCYMRGMLNDFYDPDQRRIKIKNSARREYLMIYQEQENLPVMINQIESGAPTMLAREDIINYNNFFDVYLPDDFFLNEQLINQIKASIEKYRLATRYFNLKKETEWIN